MASQIGSLQPIEYQASWPQALDPALKSLVAKVARFVWNLISIIIFPIGIVRLIAAWLKDRALRVIVPGNINIDTPVHSVWDLAKLVFRLLYNSENFKADLDGARLLKKFSGQPLTLTTPDDVKIDGAFFPGEIKSKAIIYAFGNAQQWENETPFLEQLKELNTSIVTINPRGVGKNIGPRSEEGYALDIYAAYDFLINSQGIDPNDIVLVGFSMGGAYGTCGAALAQEQYPDKEIKAININSFADLAQEVQTVLDKPGILPFLARIGARLPCLDLNPKRAWDKLKGKKCIIYNPSDAIIPKPASLYKAVKADPVGATKVIKLHPGDPRQAHNRSFKRDELKVLQNTISEMLEIDRVNTYWFEREPNLKIKTIIS